MNSLAGRKENFCILSGIQGVVKTVEETASTSGEIFRVDAPTNNTLYVAKGHVKVLFSSIPTEPTNDYNFKIVFQNSSGFFGTFAGNFLLYHSAPNEPGGAVDLKLDNPDFDITDDYTVIHLHVWYDGINFCGKIDGYV